MKKIFLYLIILPLVLSCTSPGEKTTTSQSQAVNPEDAQTVQSIFEHCLTEGEDHALLEHLCLNIGPRLSGSANAAKAISWTKEVMEGYKFDKVFLQDVMVPHWERGPAESCKVVGKARSFSILAIGGSEPTPENGVTAEVIEVQSLDEVDELGEKVKGKIVFYNRAFDQKNIHTGPGYGGAVDQRVHGASRAAKYGAAAIIIRSISSGFDDVPHTGTLSYAEEVPRIPAGALGVQSADKLTQDLKENPSLKLFLKLNCKWLPDAPSHNVVGEITGSEFPEKIILVGGHLDSWDVGHGAHDDGAGCMQSLAALRAFQQLGIRPRHTIRAVMFINEENGSRGGKKYAHLAKQNKEEHIVAIESDAGAFSPRGFGLTGPVASLEKWRSWLPLFNPNTINYINKGGGGVDIRPLNDSTGTPIAGLITDSQRMFDYHHSPNDVFEAVHPRELKLGTASLASLIYLIDTYGM